MFKSFKSYCLNKIFTIEKKRKTLMIMTNLLYGTLMEKPNYYEIQCECEKAYINSNIIIRLINLNYMYTKGDGIKRCITLAHFGRTYGHNVVMR